MTTTHFLSYLAQFFLRVEREMAQTKVLEEL